MTRLTNNHPALTNGRRAHALAIIGDVAAAHGVHVDHILGPWRTGGIVRARHEAMARIREELRLSYWQIGHIFNRCHDVVIRGIRRHKAGHPKKKYEYRNGPPGPRPALPPIPEQAWVSQLMENLDVAEQQQRRAEA